MTYRQQYAKTYYLKNKAKIAKKNKQWRKKHPEYMAKWLKKHPGYHKKYGLQHKKERQKYQRKYRQSHK